MDGGKFEYDNTKGVNTVYVNSFFKLDYFRKRLKTDATYRMIIEFRNLESQNVYDYFNICGGTSEEAFVEQRSYTIEQIKANNKIVTYVTSKKESTLKNTNLLLRSFASITKNSKFSVEVRVLLSELTDIKDYKIGEREVIKFPLQENQKLMLEDYLVQDGIHHKRKQILINGTETWKINTTSQETQVKTISFYIPIQNAKKLCLCSHFKVYQTENVWNVDKEGIWINASKLYVRINRDVLTTQDVTGFIEFLNQNNITIEYELLDEFLNQNIETFSREQQNAYYRLQNLMLTNDYKYIYCNNEIAPTLLELLYYPDTAYNNSLATKQEVIKKETDIYAKIQIEKDSITNIVSDTTTELQDELEVTKKQVSEMQQTISRMG